MELKHIIIGLVILAVVAVILFKYVPAFRDKSAKYIDKDNDGKPFR